MAEGVYTSDYGLSVDFGPRFSYEELGLNGMTYCRTLLEDGRYFDVAFPDIGPELRDALSDATVTGNVYTQPPIEGEWTLSFPYVTQPVQEIALGSPFGGLENVTLERAQLTAMSLRLTFTGESNQHYMGGQPLHLFCKDGTILRLGSFDMVNIYENEAGELADGYTLTYEQHQGADGWQYWGERDSWSYPRAVAPEDVAGFSWGKWYVPLDGGAYAWLSEVPQPTE